MATRTGSRLRRIEQTRRLFLRMHAASEKRFARAVVKFFREQGQRILARLEGHGTITPIDVANVIDWHAETQRFIRSVARPQLMSIATTGAIVALQTYRAGKSLLRPTTKAASEDDDEDDEDGQDEPADEQDGNGPFMSFDDLPAEVRDAVVKAVEETLKQPYWQTVQLDQRDAIEDAIRNALSEGTFHETPLSKVIAEVTDGEISRARGARIARTETTGMLNAGHSAAIDGINQQGVRLGREWLAIVDGSTRLDHVEANGQVIGPGEMFVVGGEEAPYPGHWSLSAEERINCRCTIVGADLSDGSG